MHMSKKQAERMRAVVNRLAEPPSWCPVELHHVWRSWARTNIIPDLQNMMPESERVRLLPLTPR